MKLKWLTWILPVAVFSVLAIGVQISHTQAPAGPGQPPPGVPSWAFPTPDPLRPVDEAEQIRVPGSDIVLTRTQVEDQYAAADWFPNENTPRPEIVMKGRAPNARACGVCHLMSGMGHPESSDLAGLPVEYMVRQMADFKSGTRKDYARMNGIAAATTEAEWREAAQWFSSLKPIPWYKVVEADMVPKTYVANPGRMRLPEPDGSMEPIGNRVIVVPQDVGRVMARDPRVGFTAYVPPGSLAKGEALATTGANGKTIACAICHGAGLRGVGDIPRLAGSHPTYLARQLYLIKLGLSNGMAAALMKPVVANLSDEDIVNIAAYIASLPVN
jgi:cytochrome c553